MAMTRWPMAMAYWMAADIDAERGFWHEKEGKCG